MNQRCRWVNNNPKMITYHDKQWGVALHDDLRLFEFLILDAFQAGLSWEIILNKRESFQSAFSHFDPIKIAQYTEGDVALLLTNPGIVRNRLKIKATITNAQSFLSVQQEFGSFDKYIWSFVGGKTIKNQWKTLSEIPTETKEAQQMSKDLKKRGFKFVGPTICYAFMQAAGLVNDHTVDCFRYEKV